MKQFVMIFQVLSNTRAKILQSRFITATNRKYSVGSFPEVVVYINEAALLVEIGVHNWEGLDIGFCQDYVVKFIDRSGSE
jgi:hypothetical protein